jgi:glyoxylase-like metal-dependent hydrolase (beta-lactamase superfamily II)/rhodanese-related sulfurtransferase
MTYDPELDIDPAELHKKLLSDQPLQLIDVRKPETFQEWSLLDSKNIPLKEINNSESRTILDPSKPIITICDAGQTSKDAAKILQDLGYTVKSLYGGLSEWNNVLDATNININESELEIIQLRRIAKGCLSYLISHNGEAAVIDPVYNFSKYLELANEKGLEIKHVFDTHLHADHVSGARALVEETGAKLHLSSEDPHNFEFIPLKNNEVISLGGKPVIRAVATPGHTKGSTSFRIKDLGMLTGDILFVDGVGRPDLADKAKEFAGDLYNTLTHKLVNLPPDTFIAPAHHGKFVQEHFHKPIITTIRDRLNDKVFKMEEDEFINYASSSAKATTQPPSYDTIIKINTGEVYFKGPEIKKLEAGPNRCAIQ